MYGSTCYRQEGDREALWTLYTILVMAVYWILELLPLPVTALLPLVILPLAGVASTDEVARNYLKVGPRHKLGICCSPSSLMFRLFMSFIYIHTQKPLDLMP